MLHRLGVLAVALLALALAAVAGVVLYVKGREAFFAPGPLSSAITLVVPKGAGVDCIAAILHDGGVIDDPRLFRVGVRLMGMQGRLRAGEYAFPVAASAARAMEILASGAVVQHRLTIPEGWTVKQALALIAEAPALEGAPPETLDEGALLPETYAYTLGEDRDVLVRRMAAAQVRVLAEAWDARAAGLPLKSPTEALVLASAVERETAVPEERAHVAAVFVNRLRLGMRLQSDPTVVYGLSDGMGTLPRPLTRRDLEAEHPFNTYVIAGLPPAPICLPGKRAIQAALNPAESKDLYFVADGNGGHVFARTLDEHNRNVAKWRAVEKRAKSAR